LKRKETVVSYVIPQELTMILVALQYIIVCPKAFVACVIVMVNASPCPAVTLDTKVIVALYRQLTSAGSTLKNSLSQSNTCRNVITQHLLYRKVFILVDVFLIYRVPTHLCREMRYKKQTSKQEEAYSFRHGSKITKYQKKTQET